MECHSYKILSRNWSHLLHVGEPIRGPFHPGQDELAQKWMKKEGLGGPQSIPGSTGPWPLFPTLTLYNFYL